VKKPIIPDANLRVSVDTLDFDDQVSVNNQVKILFMLGLISY